MEARAERARPAIRSVSSNRIAALVCAVTLVMALLISGCWGKREIEERAFVHVLGVDKGEKERLRVTAAIAIPRMMDSGSSTGGSKEGLPSIILSAEGRDVTDALSRVEALSSRELTGMHIACLLLGEDFAKEDVSPVMDVFSRSIEFRPNTLVAVCRGSAERFMKEVGPPEEAELAEYLTKMISTDSEALGFCPLVTIHDFTVGYETIESSPWAPLLDMAAPGPEGATQESPGSDRAAKELKPAAVAGTALFALKDGKYRMVGHLDPEESKAALLMAGTSRNWYLDILGPGQTEPVTLIIRHATVATHVNLEGDNVRVRFVLRLTGMFEEFVVNPENPHVSPEFRISLMRTAQEIVAGLCLRTFDKMMKMGCDGIALGRSVHSKFLTQPEWEAFNWPSKIPSVTATFDVRVYITSTGFIFQRAAPK